ncbi:TRAP-type C4-dicarboxylate transport system permease small subunit [Mitsuaria sp. BK045]|uniref:hypothetical protein n=1 Tax=unclassified Roseateles TaxID=2626991 RepID=UPI001620F525|nr:MULTISPECIES: hypothetical protein [unclassified Roseateles]MBB3293911.1 TRAP-type C4-dicarboxylate transport system permease small subunit [Mitsuaria sp. BK041]MBB3363128.1 TRAP-type C4-dicarboxylate transport system permease small subunit [Mitsuaria sp. BK045]
MTTNRSARLDAPWLRKPAALPADQASVPRAARQLLADHIHCSPRMQAQRRTMANWASTDWRMSPATEAAEHRSPALVTRRAVVQLQDGEEEAQGGGRTGIMGEKLAGMIGEAFNFLAVVPNYLPKEAQPVVNIVAGTALLGSAGYQYWTSKDGVEKIQAAANAAAAATQLSQGALQATGYDGAASVVGVLPNLIWATAEACNTFYNYNKYTATMVAAGGIKAIGAISNSVSSAGSWNFGVYSTAAFAMLGTALAAVSHASELCQNEQPASEIDEEVHLDSTQDRLYGTA